MIISMKLHSTREQVDQVRKQVEHFGYKVHSIEGEERVVIGVVGVGDVTACLESVEAMPQVEKVVPISAPYKFVSKEFRTGRTRINNEWLGNWRQRVPRHGRSLLRRIRKANHASRRRRRQGRSQNASRRSL